jgi:hypothetical protein
VGNHESQRANHTVKDLVVYPIEQFAKLPSGKLQIAGLRRKARDTVAPRRVEKTMTENKDALVSELHTRAAYAHTAAAYSHSTGDHASAQELARKALGDSVAAVKYTEKIAQAAPQPIVG